MTGRCWEVARILEPYVQRVVVVSRDDTGISSARAKTDRLDARALAMLLWWGELEAVWILRIDHGVGLAGLSAVQLPAASAGAIFHAPISNGKSNGMIWPTTPSGSWKW